MFPFFDQVPKKSVAQGGISTNGIQFPRMLTVGKADLNRATQSSGLPTRIHQQVRKLEKIYGKGNMNAQVVQDLGETTTAQAKAAEQARLQQIYDQTNVVPPGNEKSFQP